MSAYLEIRCGQSRLLLALDCVEEVDFLHAEADASGRRAWRGHSLPVCNLVSLLGLGGQASQQVVVRQGEQLCILDVSEVQGLRQVKEADWRGFAAVAQETSRFFDAALPEADGASLLRLRQPLAFF